MDSVQKFRSLRVRHSKPWAYKLKLLESISKASEPMIKASEPMIKASEPMIKSFGTYD